MPVNLENKEDFHTKQGESPVCRQKRELLQNFHSATAPFCLPAKSVFRIIKVPVAVFCNCLLLVANLAAWTIYGVLRKWGGVYVVLTALLDMAFIGVTLWLLGILTVVFSVR